MRQAIPLFLSAVALWMMWQAGNHRAYAWIVGLLNQGAWFVFIVVFDAWGLLPLNVALVFTYGRNFLKWRKERIVNVT